MLGDIQQSRRTLMMAVWVGMVQNVLSKATKYALFDPTKEMAYIPLDKESKVGCDGRGGVLVCDFASVKSPFATRPFRDGTPFLLPLETSPTLGRPKYGTI